MHGREDSATPVPEYGQQDVKAVMRLTQEQTRYYVYQLASELLHQIGSTGVHGLRWLRFVSLLGTRIYWGLVHSLSWWDVIDEHVVLGGMLMFDDLERLQGQGVGAVINLCAEHPAEQHRLRRACIESLWLPVTDAFPPTLEQIRQGVAWMQHQVEAGRTVYVHCAIGVGRSATFLACWYIFAHGMDMTQALRFLKTRRPQMTLTRRQMRRIRDYEAWLMQHVGREMRPH